jgi:hypothetical protein
MPSMNDLTIFHIRLCFLFSQEKYAIKNQDLFIEMIIQGWRVEAIERRIIWAPTEDSDIMCSLPQDFDHSQFLKGATCLMLHQGESQSRREQEKKTQGLNTLGVHICCGACMY